MREIELKPCPFCGGEAEMATPRTCRALDTGNIGAAAAVYCTVCPADMTFCYADASGMPQEDVVAHIVDQWNRRAHLEAQAPMPISSRDLIKNCGGNPDAPFERGTFPPEMRMMPASDAEAREAVGEKRCKSCRTITTDDQCDCTMLGNAELQELEPHASCYDCGRPYGDHGFADLVIPNDAWRRISPTGNDGGLLCPSCIVARLSAAGITCEGALMSGPVRTVSRELMLTMRWVENLREQGHGWSCPDCGECRIKDTVDG